MHKDPFEDGIHHVLDLLLLLLELSRKGGGGCHTQGSPKLYPSLPLMPAQPHVGLSFNHPPLPTQPPPAQPIPGC